MKNIIITGAARRIGRGLALKFAEQGWNVVVHYNKSPKEAEKTAFLIHKLFDVRTFLVQADLTQKNEIQTAFRRAQKEIGAIDVLVNNAGIFPDEAKLQKITEDDWDLAMDVNVKAAFLCSQEFLNCCSETARIINLTSLGGMKIWKHKIPYNVSKSAAIQLTKALARELAPKISVNSVAPGIIDFPNEPNGALSPNLLHAIPMQRFGNADDIFDAVQYFANCSPYITGQTLFVDGGLSLV